MSNFKVHNPKINAYAQQSPENLRDVVMMVSLSIQQQWSTVGEQMKDYRQHGLDSRFVWGNKSNTLKWLLVYGDDLFNDAIEALHTCKGRALDIRLMEIFIQVDGLGLAKAGFCCQLFAGRVGCIDVHNLRRLDIPETTLRLSKSASVKVRTNKIAVYVDACRRRRCSWLWDSWCDLIAKKQPSRWSGGDEVSQVHFDYLVN